MFTGIVEEKGIVVSLIKEGVVTQLCMRAGKIFEDLKTGDSVAVNGVCLTVSSLNKNVFTADIMNETLSRSSLGRLKPHAAVNLERALPANGRFGGHIVSGHIDGVGKITRIYKDSNAVWYEVQADKKLMKYIVEKGSIAVDGISLTVASVKADAFRVSVIPHTVKETVLSDKAIGDLVNLENDIVGKYIEQFINKQTRVTRDFLANAGF